MPSVTVKPFNSEKRSDLDELALVPPHPPPDRPLAWVEGQKMLPQMQRRLMPSLEQAGRGASENPGSLVTAHRTVCPFYTEQP